MAEKLEGAARDTALASLDGWALAEDRDAITRTFQFADFMTRDVGRI